MAGFMVLQVWRENARLGRNVAEDYVGYFPDSLIDANPNNYKIDLPVVSKALWWAEYSAPGYTDCTDPVYADTAVGAALDAFATYGNDEDPAERRELASVLWECRKLDREGGR